MGTTSVSFFPSEILLSVDQQMVNEGKILHSREVEEIVNHATAPHAKKQKLKLERCKKVKNEVIKATKEILHNMMVE